MKLVTIIDQLYDNMFSGANMVKIKMSPIYWIGVLSYIAILKNNFKAIRNEYNEVFSSNKHLYLSL